MNPVKVRIAKQTERDKAIQLLTLAFAADPANGICDYMRIKRFKEAKPESRLPDDEAVVALLENATGALAM